LIYNCGKAILPTEQGIKMKEKEQKPKKTEQILLKFTPEELKQIDDTLEIFSRSEFSSRSNFIRTAIIVGIMELKNKKLAVKVEL